MVKYKLIGEEGLFLTFFFLIDVYLTSIKTMAIQGN
jgi:hypothetical protein